MKEEEEDRPGPVEAVLALLDRLGGHGRGSGLGTGSTSTVGFPQAAPVTATEERAPSNWSGPALDGDRGGGVMEGMGGA